MLKLSFCSVKKNWNPTNKIFTITLTHCYLIHFLAEEQYMTKRGTEYINENRVWEKSPHQYIDILTDANACLHTNINIYIHICTYLPVYIYIYMHTSYDACIHTHVCICICTSYMFGYIHISMQTHACLIKTNLFVSTYKHRWVDGQMDRCLDGTDMHTYVNVYIQRYIIAEFNFSRIYGFLNFHICTFQDFWTFCISGKREISKFKKSEILQILKFEMMYVYR